MNVFFRFIKLQVLLLCPALLQAQDNSQKPVFFKSGTVYPANNFEEVLKSPATLKPALFSGYYYVVIQFSKMPTEQDKAVLKKNGVELIDYLPELAYTTILPKKLKFKCLKKLPIQSFYILQPEQKLSREILAIDSKANNDRQDVRINLITFQKMSVSQIQVALATLNAEIIEEQSLYRSFVVKLPRQNIYKIAALPFVQWVEPVAPPDRIEAN